MGLLLTFRTQDVVFVVFKNEKGKAELAVRATRDAKGFTNKPHKRSIDRKLPLLRFQRASC